ncbi:hypothetical protein CUPS4256_01100 [Campylobacter upsaliensis]|uniref:hypothetical protein n=1 Tax=Campylobacter upsaliensis TaxID=28080 RepID=UPI00214A87E6|nr:hypothetical protein [Campylobacter upsaliensis]MCR2101858.1 hypothetical protein [Campylobacter upsaliensis]
MRKILLQILIFSAIFIIISNLMRFLSTAFLPLLLCSFLSFLSFLLKENKRE